MFYRMTGNSALICLTRTTFRVLIKAFTPSLSEE